MSIDLVIGGDHGKRAYREIIKLNERITPGRKTITIFKLAHIRYNKKNGEIINIRVVYPIRDRINHICARSFIGWTHKGKKHFITLPHCFPLSLPRAKKYEMQSGCVFFVNQDLPIYYILLGKEGIYQHWCFVYMLYQ